MPPWLSLQKETGCLGHTMDLETLPWISTRAFYMLNQVKVLSLSLSPNNKHNKKDY